MYSGQKIIVSCSYADSIINLRGKLIEGFAKNNEVILITPRIHDKTTWQKLQEWKVKVFEIELYPNKFNILSDLRYLTTLCKIIRKTRPGMYFAYTIKPICYGNLAAALCKVKRVSSLFTGLGLMFQNAESASLLRQLVHRLLKLSLNINKSTTIFFQNDDDRRELLKMQIIGVGFTCVLTSLLGCATNPKFIFFFIKNPRTINVRINVSSGKKNI
ncbi:MAG TPA: glycosyltransferase [Mucilaginibacter sp.]